MLHLWPWHSSSVLHESARSLGTDAFGVTGLGASTVGVFVSGSGDVGGVPDASGPHATRSKRTSERTRRYYTAPRISFEIVCFVASSFAHGSVRRFSRISGTVAIVKDFGSIVSSSFHETGIATPSPSRARAE